MAWKDKTFDFIKSVYIFPVPAELEYCLPEERANRCPVSVWRPLNVTDDWPLAVCDYSTIDKKNDILLTDSIRRSMVSEVSLLHYNEAHKWYYLKDHGVDDLLVFRNTDSHGKLPRKCLVDIISPNSLT